VRTPIRAPRANAVAERFVGTITHRLLIALGVAIVRKGRLAEGQSSKCSRHLDVDGQVNSASRVRTRFADSAESRDAPKYETDANQVKDDREH
jgi:hypothetical protein